MKHVIEYLFGNKEKAKANFNWLMWVLVIAFAGLMLWIVLQEGARAWHATQAVQDKENCVGAFNTIPCHQYKIEKLLLESRWKDTNGPRQSSQ